MTSLASSPRMAEQIARAAAPPTELLCVGHGRRGIMAQPDYEGTWLDETPSQMPSAATFRGAEDGRGIARLGRHDLDTFAD